MIKELLNAGQEDLEAMTTDDLKGYFLKVMKTPLECYDGDKKPIDIIELMTDTVQELTERASMGTPETKIELLGPEDGYEPGAKRITSGETTITVGDQTEAGRRSDMIKKILDKQKQLHEQNLFCN